MLPSGQVLTSLKIKAGQVRHMSFLWLSFPYFLTPSQFSYSSSKSPTFPSTASTPCGKTVVPSVPNGGSSLEAFHPAQRCREAGAILWASVKAPGCVSDTDWVSSCSFSSLLNSYVRLLMSLHTALLECKCFLAMLVRHFVFHDTNVPIEPKFSATMQPRIVGREEEGAQLPLRITLVEDWLIAI